MPRDDWAPWGADVPISTPEPPSDEVQVDFGGMGFTGSGLVHNLTEVDREVMFLAPYAPEGSDG